MNTLDDILRLLNALKDMPFDSMEISAAGATVKVSRGRAPAHGDNTPSHPAGMDQETAPASVAAAQAASTAVTVISPIIGVFYASPSPEDGPFVQVGDRVKAGQTLCIVEAMKLMNEIPSPVSGTVVNMLVKDSSEVEVGQALFLLEPSEG